MHDEVLPLVLGLHPPLTASSPIFTSLSPSVLSLLSPLIPINNVLFSLSNTITPTYANSHCIFLKAISFVISSKTLPFYRASISAASTSNQGAGIGAFIALACNIYNDDILPIMKLVEALAEQNSVDHDAHVVNTIASLTTALGAANSRVSLDSLSSEVVDPNSGGLQTILCTVCTVLQNQLHTFLTTQVIVDPFNQFFITQDASRSTTNGSTTNGSDAASSNPNPYHLDWSKVPDLIGGYAADVYSLGVHLQILHTCKTAEDMLPYDLPPPPPNPSSTTSNPLLPYLETALPHLKTLASERLHSQLLVENINASLNDLTETYFLTPHLDTLTNLDLPASLAAYPALRHVPYDFEYPSNFDSTATAPPNPPARLDRDEINLPLNLIDANPDSVPYSIYGKSKTPTPTLVTVRTQQPLVCDERLKISLDIELTKGAAVNLTIGNVTVIFEHGDTGVITVTTLPSSATTDLPVSTTRFKATLNFTPTLNTLLLTPPAEHPPVELLLPALDAGTPTPLTLAGDVVKLEGGVVQDQMDPKAVLNDLAVSRKVIKSMPSLRNYQDSNELVAIYIRNFIAHFSPGYYRIVFPLPASAGVTRSIITPSLVGFDRIQTRLRRIRAVDELGKETWKLRVKTRSLSRPLLVLRAACASFIASLVSYYTLDVVGRYVSIFRKKIEQTTKYEEVVKEVVGMAAGIEGRIREENDVEELVGVCLRVFVGLRLEKEWKAQEIERVVEEFKRGYIVCRETASAVELRERLTAASFLWAGKEEGE